MKLFLRFRAIKDNDKAALVRKLIENSTGDFDFFYITALAVLMATLGLLLDSPTIVIGSMLVAPIMYPILSVALGLVMSSSSVIGRSLSTLIISFGGGLVLSITAAFFFGSEELYVSSEVLSRAEPNYIYFFVAFIAGAAVSFALARPEWSETIPGIAISVALIPPLAAIGVGIADLNAHVIKGASVLLLLNIFGILAAATASFMMMNLYQKQHIAQSTIQREDEKIDQTREEIEEIERQDENGIDNTSHESQSNKTKHTE